MQRIEPFDQKLFFKRCRQLMENSKQDEALAELVYTIRNERLDPAGLASAGRLLERINTSSNQSVLTTYKVAILGQFTTSYLAPVLNAYAVSENIFLIVQQESYDSVIQSLAQLDRTTDVVILLPWHERLLANKKIPHTQLIADELNFWQQAWQLIKNNSQARVIQVSYDWCDAGAAGQFNAGQAGGDVYLIRTLNQLMREQLPASAYFIDLDIVAGQFGRQQFYDARSYHWIRQPLSEGGLAFLAKHLWAGMRALLTGPKKVLVLDLDNTLWGGVVGEVGPLGVELDGATGAAYKDFQRTIKDLADSGVVLAVCSKNNEDDAVSVFQQNKEMVLQLSDFAAFKASWSPKSEVINIIAAELKLGLDSFVFFDDSPFEREQVRNALPAVNVVNVPEDPVDYRAALLGGLWFASAGITSEDTQRTRQYQQENLRTQSYSVFDSIDQYLESLSMEASVCTVNERNIDRVVQLLGKTNQFNLTTRRHSREMVAQLLARPHAAGFCLSLRDKFGDYGLVSFMLVYESEASNEDLIIDSWLMSCRTIARTVEQYLYNHLLEYAQLYKFSRVIGEYIPTNKNELVKNMYPDLGFTVLDASVNNKNQHHVLQLAQASKAITHVRSSEHNE